MLNFRLCREQRKRKKKKKEQVDANNLARHSNIVALFQGEPEVHVNRSLFLVL